MLLEFDDRDEMQRSLKRANIREVFIRHRSGNVWITALLDTRSMAVHSFPGGESAAESERALWKGLHFEVVKGEVVLHPGGSRAIGA